MSDLVQRGDVLKVCFVKNGNGIYIPHFLYVYIQCGLQPMNHE